MASLPKLWRSTLQRRQAATFVHIATSLEAVLSAGHLSSLFSGPDWAAPDSRHGYILRSYVIFTILGMVFEERFRLHSIKVSLISLVGSLIGFRVLHRHQKFMG